MLGTFIVIIPTSFISIDIKDLICICPVTHFNRGSSHVAGKLSPIPNGLLLKGRQVSGAVPIANVILAEKFGGRVIFKMEGEEVTTLRVWIFWITKILAYEVCKNLDGETIKKIKCLLASKFEMKDMGVADVILGVKIHKTSGGLALSQSHYIETILGKSKNLGIVPVKTPIDVNLHLSKNTGENKAQNEYASILGSLMYVMNCTRPDIACAVSKLSQFTVSPNENHWKAMKRLLSYLKHTQDYALHYTEYPAVLEGYCDANWITGTKDTKSTSGYVFTLGGAAVSWKSSKQTCIARSTMESEFIALDKASEEAEWLRNFLEDIPNWPKPMPAVCIHCDSQAAIGRARNVMYNGKSRHIRRRHDTVRQLLSSGIITIDYVKSKDNIADPLTKGLTREMIAKTSRGMGLRPINKSS